MSSAKLEEAKTLVFGGGGLATFSGSSDSANSTSKLRVLLNVSMELAIEIWEHAEDGRDKFGAPREECDSAPVRNWVWLL